MTISGFKRSQTFMALNTYFQLSKSDGCFFLFLSSHFLSLVNLFLFFISSDFYGLFKLISNLSDVFLPLGMGQLVAHQMTLFLDIWISVMIILFQHPNNREQCTRQGWGAKTVNTILKFILVNTDMVLKKHFVTIFCVFFFRIVVTGLFWYIW